MQVYVAPEVADIEALHPYIRETSFRTKPICDQIDTQAHTVHNAHIDGDKRVRMQLGSWWPQARGLSLTELMSVKFSIADARLTLAREYGFRDWRDVESLGQETLSHEFEHALDELLEGQLGALRHRLVRQPGLTTERSVYGHRATLLHYLGANGVESHRQRTPLNAPQLATLLIEHGARIDATANMYGGEQTAYMLASTSAHPHNAGIADQLIKALTHA